MQSRNDLRPLARVDAIVSTRTADEVLVYDTTNHRIHHLNPLCAVVWDLCDGTQDVEQIAGSAGLPLEHVAMALDQLNGAGLLASGMSDAPSTTSRRRLLRKAAAASAVPLLVSVSAPMSASATSGCGQYTKKWKCEQAGCKWKRGHCKPQWSSH